VIPLAALHLPDSPDSVIEPRGTTMLHTFPYMSAGIAGLIVLILALMWLMYAFLAAVYQSGKWLRPLAAGPASQA
jgi:hypothetical protein